jgi:hypothetical protein
LTTGGLAGGGWELETTANDKSKSHPDRMAFDENKFLTFIVVVYSAFRLIEQPKAFARAF